MTYKELNNLLQSDINIKELESKLSNMDYIKLKKIKNVFNDLTNFNGVNKAHDLLEIWCEEQDVIERNEKLKSLGI